MDDEMLLSLFPGLSGGFERTSLATRSYNCIAFAVGDTDQWWWPKDETGRAFWPSDAPDEHTIEAFIAAFGTQSYVTCESFDTFDDAFEYIAIYVLDGLPTHAARRNLDGRWVSKLGEEIDVTHALAGLEGDIYGQVSFFMRRPRTELVSE